MKKSQHSLCNKTFPYSHGFLLVSSALLSLSAVSVSALAQTTDADNLPSITVAAPADSASDTVKTVSSGALGDRKQVDTPFSTTAVSSEQIADMQAGTAAAAFKYDPAVNLGDDNGTGENAVLTVRGMSIDMLNGFKVDGQNFPAWDTDLPMEPFEKVELLKGLSGFMYGFGSPGGIVNYVLKRPTDENYRSVTVGVESGGALKQAVDLGGRFGNDDRFGYRINLVNEDGNMAESNGHILRQVASLVTDFRITPDLTWSTDVLYQKRKTTGSLFAIYVPTGVAVPSAKGLSGLAQPSNYYETDLFSFGTGFDYRINQDWKASVKYRYATENRYNFDSLLSVSDNAGDYSNTLYAAHTRYFYQAADAMLQGKVQTGGIGHDLVLGIGYQTQSKDYDNSDGWNNGYSLGSGNLYQTSLLSNSSAVIGNNLYRYSNIMQASVYGSDTLHLSERWSLLAGLRYTQYKETVFDADTGVQSSKYTANPVTPTLALMYKTDPDSTVYASYVEALEEGGSSSTTNLNPNVTYGPLKSKQYEVGYKTDRKSWGATASLFQVKQGYDYTNDANYYVQDGTMRYQGLDMSGWLVPVRNWKLMAGAMLLDTRASVNDASIDGKRVYGAPHLIGTSRIEYQPPALPGTTFAFGAKYVSDIAVDASNEHIIPSYTTYDLSAKYDSQLFGRNVVYRASINNLFDKSYWTTSSGYYILPGARRTAQVTATFSF